MDSRLREELARLVSGSVEWSGEILDGYSADASSYRIRPGAVVFPNDRQDVIEVVRFAAKNRIGITPRGNGTGLAGSGLGSGIMVNLREMNRVALGGDHVVVDAGVPKGKLDRILEANGKFLSPNPSVGPYCTLGGMIATNASGALALKYGSIIDNILEVEFIDGRGNLQHFPSDSPTASRIVEIAGSTDKAKFPKVKKNSCGYRLDAVSSIRSVHKVIAGSEGTLGIILSAKLKIHNLPKNRSLFIYGYGLSRDVVTDCLQINRIKPAALELVEGDIMRHAGPPIPESAAYLVFFEIDGDRAGASELQKVLKGNLIADTDDITEMNKWWKSRHSSTLNALRNLSAGPQVFEDATVPVENLDKLFLLLKKIENDFNLRIVLYGHIGSGNLHVIPVSTQLDKEAIKKIAEAYFDGVIKLGGTITGEHGDGQSRTEFVRKQYGDGVFSKFQQLKKLLDPDGILNPDKIISERSHVVRNLEMRCDSQ